MASRFDSGGDFSCAIAPDGTVHCWGVNTYGQLGYGNTATVGDDETPNSAGTVELGPGRTAVQMAAGGSHACAILDNGTVRCWGYGADGELGYGKTSNIGDNETPGSVAPVNLGAGRVAMQVAAGASHTCALLDNGTVRCWGLNANGQLGYGNATTIGDNETPGSVGTVNLGVGRTAVAISAGGYHSCALLDNGTVRCWGQDAFGQTGESNPSSPDFTKVTPGEVAPVELGVDRTAVEISAGGYHTCALLDDGTVRCWGQNVDGQLGYGHTNTIGDNETPGSVGPVDLGGHTAIAIASGGYHTCALLDNGTVECWGLNSSGQLGYGKTANIGDNETPASVGTVNLGGRSAVAVFPGSFHTCALLDDGTVKCWGPASSGQLGYGNTNMIGDNETPAAVGALDLGSAHGVIEISAGATHTCALLDDGTVRCWGNGERGRLGYGNTNDIGDDETPVSAGPVDFGAGRGVVELAAGEGFSCAILDDGTVRCWGLNSSGQLGYGNTNNIGDDETPSTAGPVNLGAGRTAVQIATGSTHACAILDNGTVRCWGNGANGRLGYGNTNTIGDDETPGPIGTVDLGGYSAISIAAGSEQTCALLAIGTVMCWGEGTTGRLGYGNTSDIGDNELPATAGAVSVGGSVWAIGTGASDTCAGLANGTVRCWGSANNGRLGYGNEDNIGDNELPSAVGPVDLGANSAALAVGPNHSCTAFDNGTVRCWGANFYGQLGYGNTATIGDDEPPASVAVVDLGSNGSVREVTVGARHTCALLANGTARCWGQNITGQLGYGNTTQIGDNETPAAVGAVDFVDDPPTALNDSATVSEDSGPEAIAVLANDTDIDGGPKEVVSKTNGVHGTVAITGGGSGLTYAPEANYCGPDSFSYELNGGSTATVSVAVTCVDDPPTALGDSTTINEDASATVVDVLANDTDQDGGPKTVESKTEGVHGTVAIIGGGAGLTYTPDSNYCGPDSSSYELNGGSTATVSITVTCVDDPPVGVNDSATLAEDSSATVVDVLANDTDIDGGPREVASKTSGTHGTVAITGGGSGVTYTPDPNYCGPDSFTYTLNGGSTATVSITVTCVDDSPLAVNDADIVAEDASATSINVLANDTDIDGGPKEVTSKTNGAHGSVAITGGGGSLTYTPDSNYCGPDSSSYELNGGSTATVSVTVTCVDDPPVAVNDSATMAEDASGQAIDVLANDTDIDGGPREVASKTNGTHGSVAITGGGTGLTFQPDPSYCGPDSFTYTLNGASSATVSITLTCVDDYPNAVNDSATLNEDAAATAIDVLANDTDVDGGPKSVASKTNGTHGSVAITGGSLTYTPDANYCGADSFTYTVNGGSTATVSVTVTCVDDSPVAVPDADTVLEDSSATAIDVLANDTDIDGSSKSIAGKTNGSHGAVTIIGGGAGLTYTPNANYCGPDSFTYTLNGGSQTTVSITVTCVEEPPPPPESGGSGTSTTTENIFPTPTTSSGPVVNITPGVGVLSGRRRPRIAIKGVFAFFTLTCRLSEGDCNGKVAVSASVPSLSVDTGTRKVGLVKGDFRIAARRSVLVRARLSPRGRELLETKRSLRGVGARMAIIDTRSGERGAIDVTLVRRPKASFLPTERRNQSRPASSAAIRAVP